MKPWNGASKSRQNRRDPTAAWVNPATQRLAIQAEIQIPAGGKSLPRSAGHRQILILRIMARWDCAPGTSGLCAPVMIARSFFVQGAAMVAIEPGAVDAARWNA